MYWDATIFPSEAPKLLSVGKCELIVKSYVEPIIEDLLLAAQLFAVVLAVNQLPVPKELLQNNTVLLEFVLITYQFLFAIVFVCPALHPDTYCV